LDQIRTLAGNVVDALNTLQQRYADEIADIPTEAAASPDDDALQVHASKLSHLTSEFTGLRNLAQQIVTATE